MKTRVEIGRRQSGFTVAEVLAAIAVLVVLMAVAVPNAVAYQRSLAAGELDGKAEQVYNAAQFQLASLKTAGRLDALSAIDGNKVSPSDYPETTGGDAIRYAVKGSAAMNGLIMPTGKTLVSAGSLTGSYVIELSPATGEVYAVYYWEDDATDGSGHELSGTTSDAIKSDYLAINAYRPNNSGDFLGEHGIGYYNGGGVAEAGSSSSSSSSTSTSTSSGHSASGGVGLWNGEELEVPVAGVAQTLAAGDFDIGKLKLSIRIQQINLDGGVPSEWNASQGQVIVRLNGGASNAPTMPTAGQYRDITAADLGTDLENLSYELDSLAKDGTGAIMDIEHQTAGYVSRGLGVRVTVYAEYEGVSQVFGPFEGNSSFGSYDSSTKTIEVSSFRHLMNLLDAPAFSNQVSHLSFTGDIVYDPAYGAMSPIDVTAIIPSGSQNSIEGNGHVLEGFVIGDEAYPADDVGLFTQLNVNLNDLTLKNPVVHGGNNVGAIIGRQENAGISISNCRVVGGTVEGASNVGGVVGYAIRGTSYSRCSSTAVVSATGENAGGFAGHVVGCSFTGCTAGKAYASGAATTVGGSGCSNVGGFVGYIDANASAIEGCQAYVDVNGVDYVGGFVGRVSDAAWSSVKDCSTSPSVDLTAGTPVLPAVSGRSYVGGFAGNVVALNPLSGCRAQARVSGTGDYAGGFAGHIASSSGENISNCKVETLVSGGAKYVPTYRGSGSHVGPFAGQSDYADLKDCSSSAVRG